eukprot:9498827-Pyramimonas_sp.AAC.1
MSEPDAIRPNIVYSDVGLAKRDRLDYVRDPAARRWTGVDTDSAQARTHNKWKDADVAGITARRDNA